MKGRGQGIYENLSQIHFLDLNLVIKIQEENLSEYLYQSFQSVI